MPARHIPTFTRSGSVYEWALALKRMLLPFVNMVGDNVTCSISDKGSAMVLTVRGVTDLSIWMFGPSDIGVDGKVTVKAGIVRSGTDFTVAEKALTCSGAQNWVTVKYTRGVDAELLEPVPDTFLQHDSSAMYFPLYRIDNDGDGNLSVAVVARLGLIDLNAGEVP